MGRIRRALGVQKPKNKDPAVLHAIRSSIDHPDPATRRDSLDPDLMAAILASTQEAQPPLPAPHPPTAGAHPAAPSLSRAFSQANPQLAKEVREHRSEMLRQTPSGIHFFDHEVTESSALVLPSFEGSTQLRSVVLSQLENAHVQREAEREGIINRPAIHPFTSHQIVLNTAGDGNCLSHACSLGIWGVHDHDRLLRRALLGTFQSPKAGAQLRQRFECQLADQGMPPDSWAEEWRKEVEAVQNTHGFSDKFLADIHCFTLANVLRHPIIIYGDKTAAMSGLAGIYLPLLWDDPAGVCSRQPVTVLYHSNHFSLLAVVEGEGPTTPPLIPLSTSDALLPVRFLLPQEQPKDGSFPSESIGRFLDIEPMREGGWGIRLQADPAPNALFSLLEGQFIQEMAASGGVPATDIPCSWSRDSPACSYRPRNLSVPPVATHMGQPAPSPAPHPGANPVRGPPRSPLHSPPQPALLDSPQYPLNPAAAAAAAAVAQNGHTYANSFASAPPTAAYSPHFPSSRPPQPIASSLASTSSHSMGSNPSALPVSANSLHSSSLGTNLSRTSNASSDSSFSSSSPFAQQSTQEWPVPRNGTRLEPPMAGLQGLSLQPQQPPPAGPPQVLQQQAQHGLLNQRPNVAAGPYPNIAPATI